jgi:hypothetical protein
VSALALPRPVTHIERSILRQAEMYVSLVRTTLGGTGRVMLAVDMKDGLILGVRGGVEGPKERFRSDE